MFAAHYVCALEIVFLAYLLNPALAAHYRYLARKQRGVSLSYSYQGPVARMKCSDDRISSHFKLES